MRSEQIRTNRIDAATPQRVKKNKKQNEKLLPLRHAFICTQDCNEHSLRRISVVEQCAWSSWKVSRTQKLFMYTFEMHTKCICTAVRLSEFNYKRQISTLFSVFNSGLSLAHWHTKCLTDPQMQLLFFILLYFISIFRMFLCQSNKMVCIVLR